MTTILSVTFPNSFFFKENSCILIQIPLRFVSADPIDCKSAGVQHYNDVIMGAIASQITSLNIVSWTVYSGTDQRKHESSVSLAFVRGIHRGPVNSPHKWPVTRKMFPFHDVIMGKGFVLNNGWEAIIWSNVSPLPWCHMATRSWYLNAQFFRRNIKMYL